MATIYGALGLNASDSSLVYVQTIGQRPVWEAVNRTIAMHQADLDAALGVFVEADTSDHTLRYYLPGGGRLQRLGPHSEAGAVKGAGNWDVALPLEEFGASIAKTRVAWAYMTMQDLDRHVKTVIQQNINTLRFEILEALLNNANDTFVDPVRGNLTVKPLADGDADLYPPVIGSEATATADHYLESGYLAAAIDDTHDPFPTIVDKLEDHFGTPTGGSNIVVFINKAQTAKVTALVAFDGVTNRFITPGDNVNTVMGLPDGMPGRVLGVHADSGAVIVEWRWLPANYMIGIHLDAPRPLLRRVDPAYTGLSTGLQLVAESDSYPFTQSHYSNRYGLGVGNRLNGVVMELGTGGTYSVPSGY